MVRLSFQSMLCASLATAALALASALAADEPGSGDSASFAGEPLWPGLEPGAYAVGYRTAHRYDPDRSFPDEQGRGRPVQISLWYPAGSIEDQPRVLWMDYFHSAATERDFSTPDDVRRMNHLEEVREAALDAGADPSHFDQALGLETLAYRNPQPAAGPFPLVVFVPGNSAPAFQNTVAYEYLASHGFVVAAFPSTGATSREMTGDEAGVSAQVDDIDFVIRTVRDLAPVDRERIGLVGFSWGGLTATFAAMRGVEVDALVALDSTLMVKRGHTLARNLRGYQPETLKIPVLMMIANAQQYKERDVSFVDELTGTESWLLRFHALQHGDFGSAIIRFFVHTMPTGGGRDVARIDAGYAAVCRYLLAFLDAALRTIDADDKVVLEPPARLGIPADVMSLEYHQGVRPARIRGFQ